VTKISIETVFLYFFYLNDNSKKKGGKNAQQLASNELIESDHKFE